MGDIDFSEVFRMLTKEEPKPIRIKITNCKNCGAPLKTVHCDYCNTNYGNKEER